MMTVVSSAKIQIGYDGEALQGGTMDVRELAPALLALGDLFQEANSLLNGGKGAIKTHVKSDFQKGSFEVNLQLLQDLADQASFLMEHCKNWSASDIAKLIGLSSGTSISLIKFLKWLRNRKIKSTTTIQNGNQKIETDADYDSIEVAPEVIRLARNRTVRMHLRAVFKPLEAVGIDFFFSKENGNDIERIEKGQICAFSVPELPEQELTDQTRNVAVRLIGIYFEQGLKWKLADGENRINASVLDDNFQKQIDLGRKFSKSDILVVQLRTKQVATGDGIKNEHEILKVLKHIPAEEQAELPLTGIQPDGN